MHQLAIFASSLFSRITHWLVIRNGARYVLAGTIGLAALGAVASNQGLPKPPSISSVLQVGDTDYGHYGWHGWHRHHGFRWYYYGRHQYDQQQPYVGNWPNISGSGGNGYVGQGSSTYGYPGSGY